jgi:hypothetical protein
VSLATAVIDAKVRARHLNKIADYGSDSIDPTGAPAFGLSVYRRA